MATYNLPPDTRAVGTGNPPADMNAVVDVLNHSVYQRIFYIDQYGADPTGATSSDTAWTNCYSDATAALQTHGGAMIVFGAGFYKFSVNTVSITDYRIGMRGQGRAATTISTTGSSGSIVKITGLSGTNSSAPISGFTAYGWNGGSGVNGIEYGNRLNGCMYDVVATGCQSRGFWFHDTTGISEGTYAVLNADQNLVNYDFDRGNNAQGSFDYSHFYLHSVTSEVQGNNAIAMRVINKMILYGCDIHLGGNISSSNVADAVTAIQVGSSTSDTAYIQASHLNVALETDASTGTVTDMTITGASNSGIIKCNGTMVFLNAGGTFTAGSVGGSSVVQCWGYLSGPLFSSHGTLTSLGTAAAGLSTYSG